MDETVKEGEGVNDIQRKSWLTDLGLDPKSQIRAIRELLRYANEDGMSLQDREICVKTLKELEGES